MTETPQVRHWPELLMSSAAIVEIAYRMKPLLGQFQLDNRLLPVL